MIRLSNSTQKLQALLGGSITTNQLPVVVNWSDHTSTAYSGGVTLINTNNTTAVDICAGPATPLTVRDVDTINVNNADTVAATITIRYNDNGTTYTLFKVLLAVGDQLTYVHGVGWRVDDANGALKNLSPANYKLSAFAPTTSAELATVITDETGSGLLVFGTSPTLTTPVLSGTVTGTYLLSGTPTINLSSGAVGSPSLYLNGEATSGLYRIGANNHGWSISGAKVLDIASTGLGVTGTFTSSGNAGIGVVSNAARALEVGSTSLTGTTQIGAAIFPTFSSGATSSVRGVNVSLTLADASYTVTNLYGLLVAPPSGGAGATVTQEFGIDIGALAKGTSVIGLRSQVAAASNYWNIYASGTANNAFAGNVRIGSTTAPTNALDVTGVATVSGQASFGTASVNNNAKFRIDNTLTSGGVSSTSHGSIWVGTVTGAAGDTTYQVFNHMVPTGLVTNGTGEAISYMATLSLTEPVITLTGADTVNTAATVYIASAPTEGATNAALYVASGASIFQGNTFIGDTSNANSTIGLTINQGANDDEIFTLKSSDVAHGMTTISETDSYAFLKKLSATDGGVYLAGLSEVTGGLLLRGIHTTDTTTKTTAASGAVRISGELKSGTTSTTLGADANILVVQSSTTTRFILDADGDSHQDVGTAWTNFDHLDDVATLDALAYNVARPDDPIKRKFGEFLADKREVLEQQRIVKFNDDGHHFVNMSKLTMLHTGAIRQIGEKLEMAERVIERLSNQLQRLKMNHANPNH